MAMWTDWVLDQSNARWKPSETDSLKVVLIVFKNLFSVIVIEIFKDLS